MVPYDAAPEAEACRWLAAAAEARCNHRKVPTRHRQEGRTSPLAARAFEEARRRPTVILHLWDEASVVKLVVAELCRVSERWGKKPYREFAQHQSRALRQTLGLAQQPEAPALVTTAPHPRRSAASAHEFLQEKKDLTDVKYARVIEHVAERAQSGDTHAGGGVSWS